MAHEPLPTPESDSEQPQLLPPPPSYPLLGPPSCHAPAPHMPLSDLVAGMTELLLHADSSTVGERLQHFANDLNQQLTSSDGGRRYYAYPTESLERLQRQLAFQGRSAGNEAEGTAWRHLARAFAMAMQERGLG